MSDDLLGGLRQAGSVESEGHFTVDRVAARRKLGVYRYATPEHWTLPLLAHATRAGARLLEIEGHGTAWRIKHNGASLSADEMTRLVTDTDEPVPPSLGALIDCIDALMALEASFEFSSGLHVVTVEKGVPSEAAPLRDPCQGIKLSIKGARVVPVNGAVTPLEQLGRWAPPRVMLNNQVVTQRPMPHDGLLLSCGLGDPPAVSLGPLNVVAAWDGGFPLALAVTEEAGRLILVVDGIGFEVAAPRFKALGVYGVAWLSNLSLDLSYGSIIENEAFAAVRARLDAELAPLLAAAARRTDALGRLSSDRSRLQFSQRLQQAAEGETRPQVLRSLFSGPLHLEAVHPMFGEQVLTSLLRVHGPRLDLDAVEALEPASFERFLDGDAAQGRIYRRLIEILCQHPPHAGSLRWMWRGVVRAAMSQDVDEAVRLASDAVTLACRLPTVSEVDRATAHDVRGLALRWQGNLDEAERMHAVSRACAGDSVVKARRTIFEAELMLARGAVGKARQGMQQARSVLAQRYTEKADTAYVVRELAELAWLEGDEKAAYTLWRQSVWQYDEADRLAASAALETLELLRERVRHHEGMWFCLHDILTVFMHLDPLVEDERLAKTHPLQRQHAVFRGHLEAGSKKGLVNAVRPFVDNAEGQVRGLTWTILSRRLVLALRLEGRWAEADRLLARRRLVMRFWPLDGTTVLAWFRRPRKPTSG